jgi:VWFA-related protein
MKRERDPYPNTSTGNADNDSPARNDKQRPVLRRPTDPEPQSNQGSRPPNTGRPSGNPSEPANEPQGNPDDEVIRLESTLVNIPLLVSDRSGRYISRLNKNDFTLYEDGVLQEITNFTSEEVPFNVVLLLDMSPSVQGSTEEIHDAAIAFVRQMRPQDRVMIGSFDRNVQFLTDFTNDRRRLEQAIQSTYTGSGTSVYDAVYETVARRLRNVEGRKALILFSDGEDTTSSHASYDDAIEIVTESDVLVYGLRYPGSGSIQINPWPRDPWPQMPFPIPWPWPRRRRGTFMPQNITSNCGTAAAPAAQWPRNRGGRNNGDFMTDITTAGGGPVYDAQQINDLSRLAYQIAEELRNTYTLSYYPKNNLSNGGYRSIRIRVRSRDDLAVRHRKGYDAGNVHRPSRT